MKKRCNSSGYSSERSLVSGLVENYFQPEDLLHRREEKKNKKENLGKEMLEPRFFFFNHTTTNAFLVVGS